MKLAITLRSLSRLYQTYAYNCSSSVKVPEELGVGHFAQLDIRIGQISEVWNHPSSELLYCEKVKLISNPQVILQIASGLRKFIPHQKMTGNNVIVLANLKPRKFVGFESQGMLLCASTVDKSICELVIPQGQVGQRIFLQGHQQLFPGDKIQPVLNPKKKLAQKCLEYLRTDEEGLVIWKKWKLKTKAGYLRSGIKNGIVS